MNDNGGRVPFIIAIILTIFLAIIYLAICCILALPAILALRDSWHWLLLYAAYAFAYIDLRVFRRFHGK